jgi:hypothetical protein
MQLTMYKVRVDTPTRLAHPATVAVDRPRRATRLARATHPTRRADGHRPSPTLRRPTLALPAPRRGPRAARGPLAPRPRPNDRASPSTRTARRTARAVGSTPWRASTAVDDRTRPRRGAPVEHVGCSEVASGAPSSACEWHARCASAAATRPLGWHGGLPLALDCTCHIQHMHELVCPPIPEDKVAIACPPLPLGPEAAL